MWDIFNPRAIKLSFIMRLIFCYLTVHCYLNRLVLVRHNPSIEDVGFNVAMKMNVLKKIVDESFKCFAGKWCKLSKTIFIHYQYLLEPVKLGTRAVECFMFIKSNIPFN